MYISLLTCKYGKHFLKWQTVQYSMTMKFCLTKISDWVGLTMCLFENKWINKEKNSRDFSLDCYLNFEKRQKKPNKTFQNEFPVDLISSSSTIVNRFFMKVNLLYFFTNIFSSILTVKHLSLNFVCFLILLEKC